MKRKKSDLIYRLNCYILLNMAILSLFLKKWGKASEFPIKKKESHCPNHQKTYSESDTANAISDFNKAEIVAY